jgi:two-component system phosphate regulon sensor histidine kinase PhoR
LIIILMAISLAGIAALEWYWLRNAYDLKAEEFDQNVNAALNDVVDDLEERETIFFIKDQIGEGELGELEILMHEIRENDFVTEEIVLAHDTSGVSSDMEMVIWAGSESDDEELAVIRTDEDSETGSVMIRRYGSEHEAHGDTTFTKRIEHRVEIVGSAMQHILVSEMREEDRLQSRLEDNNLDSLISSNLSRRGISLPYNYGITDAKDKDLLPEYGSSTLSTDETSKFSKPIFAEGISPLKNALVVDLPNKSTVVLNSMGWILAGALGLTFIMLVTFSLTIFFILRQKKVSRMKSDFINNMTHEFKTPLATIGLAVDSIEHPEVRGESEQVSYFTGIIKEENKRMNRQVEQVLQAARIEQGNLKFNFSQIDFNSLVEKAARQMDIQVQHREGNISCDLYPSMPDINGDEMHLYNAIVNLLDNAIKYCKSAPKIALRTLYSSDKVEFEISDNGIGMSSETQKKVFDRFFRAQGGDLHDVKGFGLGLNYVKAIVDRHQGSIAVNSQPGHGTTIKITLPKSLS